MYAFIKVSCAKSSLSSVSPNAVSYTHLDVYKRQYLMYALFGVTVGLTVIAAIAQFGAALKDNPIGAIKSLLGLVLLVACLLYTSLWWISFC